jgi:hypothetical protein
MGQFFRGVDGPGGKDRLEELIDLGQSLALDRLIGVVRDDQGIVEVDLSVMVCQGRPSASVDDRRRPVREGADRRGPPPEVDSSGAETSRRAAGGAGGMCIIYI